MRAPFGSHCFYILEVPHYQNIMSKYDGFIGQPVFTQLLSFIDFGIISKVVDRHDSDRYYKKFKTKDHLITMLYSVFHKCTSLREVTSGMQACLGKLSHLGLSYYPRRSTLADANKSRSFEVFEDIYTVLYKSFRRSLSDSRKDMAWYDKLYIIDATSISLFKEILKNGGGRTPASGKRKGGVKVHTLIKANEDVPCLVRLTSGATHDVTFIKGLKLPAGSIVTFDKGYFNYSQYERWKSEQVDWITRLKQTGAYTVIEDIDVTISSKNKGVLLSQKVNLGYKQRPSNKQTQARLIVYFDAQKQKEFKFITSNLTLPPETIAEIYKHRWQIELLFKRVKQNFPLEYFLGDSENAIKLQIWICLIADLILKYLKSKIKRPWSFSNLSSIVRIHLMSYIKLLYFLNNPEKLLVVENNHKNRGPTLFDSI